MKNRTVIPAPKGQKATHSIQNLEPQQQKGGLSEAAARQRLLLSSADSGLEQQTATTALRAVYFYQENKSQAGTSFLKQLKVVLPRRRDSFPGVPQPLVWQNQEGRRRENTALRPPPHRRPGVLVKLRMPGPSSEPQSWNLWYRLRLRNLHR